MNGCFFPEFKGTVCASVILDLETAFELLRQHLDQHQTKALGCVRIESFRQAFAVIPNRKRDQVIFICN